MWRQRCSDRENGKEQKRGNFLSTLLNRKESAVVELGWKVGMDSA